MSDRVSDSEKIVMEVLWQESPLSSVEVIERLAEQAWTEKTVKTFLNRLVKKKAITFSKEGRRYWYSPLVAREELLREESSGFLQKVFNGDMRELLATFVDNKQLSAKELEYLRSLLDEDVDNKPADAKRGKKS